MFVSSKNIIIIMTKYYHSVSYFGAACLLSRVPMATVVSINAEICEFIDFRRSLKIVLWSSPNGHSLHCSIASFSSFETLLDSLERGGSALSNESKSVPNGWETDFLEQKQWWVCIKLCYTLYQDQNRSRAPLASLVNIRGSFENLMGLQCIE